MSYHMSFHNMRAELRDGRRGDTFDYSSGCVALSCDPAKAKKSMLRTSPIHATGLRRLKTDFAENRPRRGTK